MSNVLPTIIMPAKEPEPEPVPENKLPEQEGNMELIDQLMEEKEVNFEVEDDIINVEEREIPEEEEVFTDPPLRHPSGPKVAPVLEEDEPPNEFTQKKGKRKYTRTKPMSDKQKAHLAKIRQIAIEKRKAEKERKLKEKEEAVIAKAEKKILDKRKKEEEAEAQQAEQQKPKEQPKPSVIQQNGFTKDDLDNAVLSAISQYDTLRKQRKKEKVERESKQREEDKMRATLARAIQPQKVATHDPWRSLFS